MSVRVPPAPVRALVITPITFIGALGVTILSPVLHLVLAAIDLIDRKNWRFTRIVGLGIAFCVVETFGLVMAFLLWIASGFGLWMRSMPIQRLHLWVFGMWLEMITAAIRTFLGFEFEFSSQQLPEGPSLVFSRHAGPGDALLVAHSLIRDHERKVRMLGTTKLLWDPFFNHVVRRLPFHFCEQDPADPERELAEVRKSAATIEVDGAMIIFPEGGNYTPKRWLEAQERLERRGLTDRADRARRMTHVLPPRTAGAVAALDAAPHANVVFVAHVGLDDLFSLGDLWRRVPIRRTVQATYWAADRPVASSGSETTAEWLWAQWELVDLWIESHSNVIFGTGVAE
jgi:1-acyl-sn-glycerol-3-phosphate acyltransferase